MTLVGWAILLFVVGIVLLVAELFLPTHGALGVLGILSMLAAVGITFILHQGLGLALLIAGALASPLVWTWTIRLWPRTPVGRRLMLQPLRSPVLRPTVRPGQVGLAISELRPMGVCEFDGQRVEAISELGIVAAGHKVKVVDIIGQRPTVRAVEAGVAEQVQSS